MSGGLSDRDHAHYPIITATKSLSLYTSTPHAAHFIHVIEIRILCEQNIVKGLLYYTRQYTFEDDKIYTKRGRAMLEHHFVVRWPAESVVCV